jgi:hypothetical protein
MKDPERFKDNTNFLPYYRKSLRSKYIDLIRRNKPLKFVYVDISGGIDHEFVMEGRVHGPEDGLIIREDIEGIVKSVFSFLNSNPYTSARSKYFVWPVIYAFLCGSLKLWDSLEFRHRVALRTVSTLAIRRSGSAIDLHGRWSMIRPEKEGVQDQGARAGATGDQGRTD